MKGIDQEERSRKAETKYSILCEWKFILPGKETRCEWKLTITHFSSPKPLPGDYDKFLWIIRDRIVYIKSEWNVKHAKLSNAASLLDFQNVAESKRNAVKH